jgi:hypothetical protein
MWYPGVSQSVIGRLELHNSNLANNSSFSCGSSCLCTVPQFLNLNMSSCPSPLVAGTTANDQVKEYRQDCKGNLLGPVDDTALADWSSDNSTVLSVSNISGSKGQLTANGAGSANITAKVLAVPRAGINSACPSSAFFDGVCAQSVCAKPNAPDPGSISRFSYNVTATPPPASPPSGVYGQTLEGSPVATFDISVYYDSSSTSWKTRLSSAVGNVSTWVRLLPGVSEASASVATASNQCKMIADLRDLGTVSPNWYVLSAVQAHENVHVGEFESSFNGVFSNLLGHIEALSLPFHCGDTVSSAKAAIKALPAYGTATAGAISSANSAYGAIADPNAATNSAEHTIVDPIIAAIQSKAAANHWSACP